MYTEEQGKPSEPTQEWLEAIEWWNKLTEGQRGGIVQFIYKSIGKDIDEIFRRMEQQEEQPTKGIEDSQETSSMARKSFISKLWLALLNVKSRGGWV